MKLFKAVRAGLLFTVILFLLVLCVSSGNAQDIIKSAASAHVRGGLGNAFQKFEKGGDYAIGYFGASITNGAGASSDSTKWRWLVHRWLEKEYPESTFKHVHVVNGGTGSDLGACRLGREILSHDPALVFVEFAVNDGGKEQEYIFRTVEGIVRQIRKKDPTTEIIFLYTLAQNWLETYKDGKLPRAASAFEVVAEHYGVPAIDVAYVAAEELNAGRIAWDEFAIDAVHPKDLGYRIYAEHIISCLKDWRRNYRAAPHPIPEPLREDNWENAGMVMAKELEHSANWVTDTDIRWDRFTHFPNLFLANKPGEWLRFRFKGTHFGVYDIMTMDSGSIDVFVDGKLIDTRPRWDRYCLRSSRTGFTMLASELEDTVHDVEIRVSGQKEPESAGHALRIGFVIMRGELVE